MIKIRGGGGGGGGAREGGGRTPGGKREWGKGTVAEGEKFYECGCQCKATAHLPPRPSQINTGSKSPQPRMLAACQGPPSPCSGHSKQRTHTHTLCLSVSHTHTLELSLSLTHIHTHTNLQAHTHLYKVLYIHSDLQACTQSSKRERD